MAGKTEKLLNKYGQTFCDEIGITLKNTPSALFQWLYSSVLFSARIGSEISVNAAKALIKNDLTTPEKMDNTTWSERVKILNNANYTRYQEKTSTFLGEIASKLKTDYNGNLKNLREKAQKDPNKIRDLLTEFKGEGEVGVDIFFRETQLVWDELYPFADKKALQAAEKMNLPKTAKGLLGQVNDNKKKYVDLIAALVRADLANDHDLRKEADEKKQDKSKGASSLEEMSKNELYNRARKKNIPGRSKMSKKELVKVLG